MKPRLCWADPIHFSMETLVNTELGLVSLAMVAIEQVSL